LRGGGHLEAGAMETDLVEVDPGVMRVDGGYEVELGIIDDGLAHALAHSPTGPEHADPNHVSVPSPVRWSYPAAS